MEEASEEAEVEEEAEVIEEAQEETEEAREAHPEMRDLEMRDPEMITFRREAMSEEEMKITERGEIDLEVETDKVPDQAMK